MIYDQIPEYYGEFVLKWCLDLILSRNYDFDINNVPKKIEKEYK